MTEKTMWPLPVHTRIQVTPHGIHAEQWDSNKSIDLALPSVQDELFRSFCHIRSPKTLVQWIQKYGCPWEAVGEFTWYDPNRVMELARCVQWIWYFSRLLKHQQVDFVRKHLRFSSRVSRYTSRFTEEEWMALVERVESGDQKDMDDIATYYMATKEMEHLECGDVIFSRIEGYESEVMQVESLFGLTPSPMSVDPRSLAIEVTDIETKHDDYAVLEWGHVYLKNAITAMLASIQTTAMVEKPANTGEYNFRLHQVLKVSSPWQAIVAELVRRITGEPMARKCANPNCTETFIPSRADNVFCARPGCRKAVSRKKMKTAS